MLSAMARIATIVVIGLLNFQTQAATLLGNINVDDIFKVYLSTDDATQGATLLAFGNNWTITNSFSTTALTAGTSYYLHVEATDVGGPAAFLGNFSLIGSGHYFEDSAGTNLGTSITTNDAWKVSKTGWSSYVVATEYGLNGVYPWERRAEVDSTAKWIWTADNYADNSAFFSIAIVPDETDLAITKTLDTAGSYAVGDTVTYTITVTNNGATAKTVKVTDTASNLTIISAKSPNCIALPCTIASMANGATEVITVIATIDSAGYFSNTADVTTITAETNTTNNTATAVGGFANVESIPTLSRWALMLLSLLLLASGLVFKKCKN